MGVTEIGPIQIETDASDVRFRFAEPDSMLVEIPPSLEGALSGYVDEHRGDLEGKRVVIDLADAPSVSSRHLGIMMTIQKVAQSLGPVELIRVSQGVRDLLALTRMAGYFNLSE